MALFRPDEYLVSVLDIDPDRLVRDGYRGVLLDVDNTLMPRTRDTVPANIAAWVASLKEAGLEPLILSNSFKDRVTRAAEQLDVGLVGKALKPLPRGFRECRRVLGMRPRELVMVGDQTYTDILGGNLCGLHTILVTPLSKVDLRHTVVLRKLDALFLLGMHPQGGAPAFQDEEDEGK